MKVLISLSVAVFFSGNLWASSIEGLRASYFRVPAVDADIPVPEAPEATEVPAPQVSPEVKALSDASIKLLTDEMALSMNLTMITPFISGPMSFLFNDVAEIEQEMETALAKAKEISADLDKVSGMLKSAAAIAPAETESRGLMAAVIMLEQAPGYLDMALDEMAKIKKAVKKMPAALKSVDAELKVIQEKQAALKPLVEKVKAAHSTAGN
ncbi:MAG: hypothetical protein FD189_1559 [Elusimicrobia bacterium]|nr:MAG: hypothetical protein FD154_1794 [Elusimicrobiota bacterium]KAF0155048.1 MAG: hypothetical protein FD189_1559 [Elusimicrobiota bacterium]